MSKKQTTLLTILALYLVLAVAASFFHANNFRTYSDNEGAAEINYMEFLFFTSLLYQGVMYWMLKSINWKLAILSTIVNLLVSIALTILIIDWGEYSESAEQLIKIYGFCYMVIFSVIAWVQVRLAWG